MSTLPPQYPAPGQSSYPAGQPQQASRTNTLAIVSLIASFFISIVGIICGHIALSQIKRSGEDGRGLAIAGLIIGYAALALEILAVIGMILLLIFVPNFSVTANTSDTVGAGVAIVSILSAPFAG